MASTPRSGQPRAHTLERIAALPFAFAQHIFQELGTGYITLTLEELRKVSATGTTSRQERIRRNTAPFSAMH
jgi:hypothetical protein